MLATPAPLLELTVFACVALPSSIKAEPSANSAAGLNLLIIIVVLHRDKG